jgi:hypothetical protein
MTHLSITEAVAGRSDPRPRGGEHVTEEEYNAR